MTTRRVAAKSALKRVAKAATALNRKTRQEAAWATPALAKKTAKAVFFFLSDDSPPFVVKYPYGSVRV